MGVSENYKKWILGAYGNYAGTLLLEELGNCTTREGKLEAISRASRRDTRMSEIDPEQGRVMTPFPGQYELNINNI